MTFSVACFVGYFWSTYVVPETGNVSLEEMDEVFGSSAGVEDSRLKFQVRTIYRRRLPCSSHRAEQIERELGLHDLINRVTAGSTALENE